MNFIFRAIKSLKERKGKTLITFSIILTICLVILTSFSIQSATELASISARQKLGAQVTLSQDMEKMMEENKSENGEPKKFEPTKLPVPLTYINELKDSDYVLEYAVNSNTSANLNNLTAVGSDDESENSNDNEFAPMKMPNNGDVTIYGLNDFNVSDKVESQTISLQSGRDFTEDDLNKNVVLIESTFADQNDLEVGDKITLSSTEDEDTSVEAEIIGIFKDNSEIDDNAYRFTSMLPYNSIYAPYTLANELKGDDYKNAVDSITFYINDPLNVDSFIEESQNNKNIDFDQFKLDAGDRAYESMMGPIENVASFSKTTLIIVTIFGAAILTLITMLSIKDRMHEMGILMALGEKKFKIIGQLLAEILIILTIALGASTLFGNPISNIVGNKLIQNEISVQSEQSMDQPGVNRGGPMGGGKGGFMNTNKQLNEIDPIDDLDIQVSSSDFAKMSLCSIVVAMIATIIPASFIMRLNPKNILSKHN